MEVNRAKGEVYLTKADSLEQPDCETGARGVGGSGGVGEGVSRIVLR